MSAVPSRSVYQCDALAWLREHPAPADASVITSLPDVAEMPEHDFDTWRAWFSGAVKAVLDWVPPQGAAVLFQTDVLHQGIWVDKSHLVQNAAEGSGHGLVWHKIVCRAAPGAIRSGRPGYSHLLCLSRVRRPAFRYPSPDVLPDAGAAASQKAMGVLACEPRLPFRARGDGRSARPRPVLRERHRACGGKHPRSRRDRRGP